MNELIRFARPDEVPFLCNSIASLELWQQLAISSEVLQFACNNDPDRVISVAESAGKIRGCIMFRPERALNFLCERVFRNGILYPADGGDCIHPRELPDGAYVNMLAVFPGNQGTGIGAKLLDAAEQLSASHSDRMYLCVSKINPRGRSFYERQGYTFTAEARDCVKKDNVEHLMSKPLGSKG